MTKPVLHGRDHRPGGADPIPGLGSEIYKDDQLLDADTDEIVFADIHSNLAFIEIHWRAVVTDGDGFDDYFLVARFNDDDVDLENDYRWNFHIVTDTGSLWDYNRDDLGDEGAPFGALQRFGANNVRSQGKVVLDDFTNVTHGGGGTAWSGFGTSPLNDLVGDGTESTVFQMGGRRDPSYQALTKITIRALAPAANWAGFKQIKAGSRFTLIGIDP